MFLELINEAYTTAVSRGWYKDPASNDTRVALIHSEISEALKADRECLVDDHLVGYDGYWVELADMCIRIFDFFGYAYSKVITEEYMQGALRNDEMEDGPSKSDFLAVLHTIVSFYHITDGGMQITVPDPDKSNSEMDMKPWEYLVQAVVLAINYAKLHDVDLISIIKQKMAYNKTRKDHDEATRTKRY